MKRRPQPERADTTGISVRPGPQSGGVPAVTVENALAHNPYVDSFPNSTISPYGASFPPAPGQQLPNFPLTSAQARRGPRTAGPRQIAPQRTTKTTQKLVLFPDDGGVPQPPPPSVPSGLDEENGPWYSGYNEVVVPDVVPDAARTEAERMSKDERTKLPRVTSHCIAEGYKITEIAKFVRNNHSVSPKKYDECLYVSYDVEAQAKTFGAPKPGPRPIKMTHIAKERVARQSPRSPVFMPGSFAEFPDLPQGYSEAMEHTPPEPEGEEAQGQPSWMSRGEVFIFDYGVIVFWNLSEAEEQAYLRIIRQFAVEPLPKDESENEDFHYQYDLSGPHQPRIFNDMITLKSGSELIKLTISHGLAQSVKLAFFENVMEVTIDGTIPLPRAMAKHGEVKMTRTDVMKIVGQLFTLKMNVNLISNVLDTPELFWSEPELEGLYNAIRGYLEISQRAKLLNTRADIISDLLNMLTDHMNSNEMSYITWVVIILIMVAVVIAAGEVWVKVLRLRAGMED
ncbi:hypothetical protein HKX48_001983 [Thoreauomyces humboldtii]|nr:hypothetical protein HKX48_001983 [Thoreauomyces humboldtii]